MKRFLPILFLLCALGARAADTYILMTNWNTDISAGANRDVFVKPLLYSNNFPVSPIDTRKYTSDSTPAFYISNQLSGYYQLDIQAPPQTRRLWLRVPNVTGKWVPTVLDFDFINASAVPSAYTRDQTDAAIRNAMNGLSGGGITNYGVGTNITLSDQPIAGTNAFYFRNGTAADGNYFFTRAESGVRIFTNGNGYAVGYDAAQAVQDLISIFPTTNGAVSTWIALYATTDTSGKSNWFEGDGIQQFPVETGDAYTSPLLLSGWGAFYPSLIVAGRLEGSGATLTNVNISDAKSATLPLSAINPNGSLIINGALTVTGNVHIATTTNGDRLTIGTNNILGAAESGFLRLYGGQQSSSTVGDATYGNPGIGQSMFAPSYGGSGSGLSGLPIHGPELKRKVTGVPFYLYGGASNNCTEGFFTNNVAAGVASGLIPTLQSFGFAFMADPVNGWVQSTRDSAGRMRFKTNSFPDGPIGFRNALGANGVGVVYEMYFNTSLGSNGFPDAAFGLLPVVNMSSYTIDITNFYSWGATAIRFQDMSPSQDTAGKQLQMMGVVNHEILYPAGYMPAHFGFTNMWPEYFLAGSADQLQFPEAMMYECPVYFNDQGSGNGTGVARSLDQIRWAWTNTARFMGPGFYGQDCAFVGLSQGSPQWNTTAHAQAAVTAAAVMPAFGLKPSFTNATELTFNSILTNYVMVKEVWGDLAANAPACIYFNTGVGGLLKGVKPISDGGYLVFCGNDTSTNFTFVFDWSTNFASLKSFQAPNCPLYPFCINSNYMASGLDPWNGTNVPIVTQAGKMTVTNNSIGVMRLYPAPVVNITGNAATATRATIATNTIGPLAYDSSTGAYTNGAGTTVLSAGLVNGSAVSGTVTLAATALAVDGSGITGQYIAAPVSAESAIAGPFLTTNANKIIPSHNASAFTNLAAANLTGTIADARLSANVALLNSANTYTASNHIPGAFEGSGILLTNLNASQLATGLIPKAQAGSVTNVTDVKITGTAPAIGDTWQYDGSNWTNRPIQGYIIDLFDTGNNSMSANTTYYYGKMSARVINTTYGIAQIDVPKAGTIKRVQYKTDTSGTAGSGEVVNFYIEINNATDVFNWAFAMTASFTNNVVTGSQAVVAGDTIVLKVATPATWSTPAAAVRLAAQVYIE